MTRLSLQQLLRRLVDMLIREAELLLQLFQGGARAEGVHGDDRPMRPDVALPAERRRLFDRDTARHIRRQDFGAVRILLMLEEVPRRHADDAGTDADLDEPLVR